MPSRRIQQNTMLERLGNAVFISNVRYEFPGSLWPFKRLVNLTEPSQQKTQYAACRFDPVSSLVTASIEQIRSTGTNWLPVQEKSANTTYSEHVIGRTSLIKKA